MSYIFCRCEAHSICSDRCQELQRRRTQGGHGLRAGGVTTDGQKQRGINGKKRNTGSWQHDFSACENTLSPCNSWLTNLALNPLEPQPIRNRITSHMISIHTNPPSPAHYVTTYHSNYYVTHMAPYPLLFLNWTR